MVPGAFSDIVTLDIYFADEAVVHCNVPVVKKMVISKCSQINFDVNT